MGCEGEQRERYLLPAARGERFDALAMTEPGAGSDVRGMQCFARRDGGDWVVNGTKHFISHADLADFVIVFVATGEEETARGPKKRITCFLVDRGAPGFEIRPGYDSVSHRGLPQLHPHLRRLPAVGRADPRRGSSRVRSGERMALRDADHGRGGLRGAGEEGVRSGAHPTRPSAGSSASRSAASRGVSFKLADMITEIDAANWLTLAAAWRLDQALPADREIASAKMYASEMLARVTDEAIQIHGGMGLMSDLPLARFWRDARIERIWDGTSEIQRHIIGRDLLRPLGA